MNQASKLNTIKNGIWRSLQAFLLLAFIALHLSSCKENEVVPYGQPANLNMVNADTNALNIYLNGARINDISSIAPGSQMGYMSVAFGAQIYQLKIAGAIDYLINNIPLKLDTSGYYTLFVAGETADKLFLSKDGLPAYTTNSALIRVVNASPAVTYDVVIGALSYTSQPFKAITNYTNIASGITKVTITQTGTTTVLYTGSITLTAGLPYTLYTKGKPGATGKNAFAAILNPN
jgi:hypothetical protein